MNCAVCKKQFTHEDRMAEEIEEIDGKKVHADCYYEKLGEEVEKHPIYRPRIRRS